MLQGCDNGSSTSKPPDSGGTTPATTNTCSSPKTSVISRGERSTATTVGVRGAWSDIKVIPNTNYPGTAYTDTGCSCVRYTYWNGSKWETEVIAAGNATSFTYVRLAYLSTGIPIVLWSNSTTTLQMAIRNSADRTKEDDWTITNILTTGATVRAIEIKVNPSDQVAILFTRATASTAHLVLCLSNCSNGVNYSSPSGTLGTVGTTPVAFGLGWCNSGSGYYPTVALTGAANTSFAVCRQNNLQDCLTGIASWSGGTLHTFTGSGANRSGVQLAMDETTIDTPIRAILNNGSALAYYQSAFAGGGCASGTLAAMAAAGTIAGTTVNTGSSTLELVRVSGNNYHLIANEGTASVRYYNTTTGSFTAWNAAGIVATPTLAAAGTTRGGLAVDVNLEQAYTSFARTAAASAFNGNLMFGLIEETATASNNASAAYYESPFTVDGQLQMLTNQIPNIALSTTSASVPAVAYVDYSSGAVTTGVLKYGLRNGSTSSSSWLLYTVPVVGQPQNIALAFDENNKPWIAVYNAQSFRFYLTTNTQTDGSGIWSTYTFPLNSVVTAATAPVSHSVALVMDKSTSSVRPVMLVGVANHGTLSTTGVWAAKLNPETSNWSNLTQLVSTNAANSVSNLSADSNSSGTIAVTYYNRGTSNRVEYVQSVNGGTSWSTATNISVLTGMGMGLNIKLNPSNGRPALSYFDKLNNRVYYNSCQTSISQCSTMSNWSSQFVDNLTAGVSGLAATSEGLLSTGLSFTDQGEAYVTYPAGSGANGGLMLNKTSSGTFGTTSLLKAGKNANLTVNTTISAINFGQSGWGVQSVRTAAGALHSAYIGPNNWLYITSCENE